MPSVDYLSAREFPTKLSFPAVAQLRDTFCIVGGWDGESNFDTIYCYDPEEDTWPLLPNRMRYPRRAATAILVNSKIFGSCS